jgi:hypothetical protein
MNLCKRYRSRTRKGMILSHDLQSVNNKEYEKATRNVDGLDISGGVSGSRHMIHCKGAYTTKNE